MKKKTVKKRYGVRVGDIFNIGSYHEDGGGYSFYQVIALRGETQVAVREIGSKVIAFDGVYEGVVPVPNAWISDDVLVRKIHEIPLAPSEGQKAASGMQEICKRHLKSIHIASTLRYLTIG